MATMDSDSHSTCSSLPSAAVNQPRKQSVSIRRFSIRRFIYSSPLGRLREGRRRWLAGSDPEEGIGSSHQNRSKNASKYEHTHGASTSTSLTAVIINHGTQTTPCDSQSAPLAAATSTWGTGGDQSLDILECPLCLTELHVDLFPQLITCSHRSCRDCMRQYLRIEISESRVNICCPECSEALHPSDIQSILQDDVIMAKWEEFMLRRLLVAEPDVRWCPAPDCGFAVIASGCASCPRLRCERPGCHTYFCYHCKQEWHPNLTCDAARAQRSPYIRNASVSYGQDSSLPRDDIKPCPRCQVLVVKMDDGSCNHMTCAFCGAEFCWLCMKEISDLHYLSPSGCTFWGKKPWSRKKKILWQLGTLVGAPVGIGLVAGIAVPTIIIGIPVWVARKLHARYEHASRRKRNLVITGSVLASVLVSPILAGLAVGIGVPILLAYVYCVVPISLCRSGGCGVTTSASGVRFDFDEDETVSGGNTGHTTDGQSVDTSRDRVANPSIGDVSLSLGPCSVSLGSGSALGMKEMDRESNTGLAGSITGHRLEVHADVSSGKRFSLTSETASATVSLSEKSDDASTRALAGSLLGYRSREPVTCYTPAEVHIDSVSQCSVTTGDDVRSDDVTLRSSARLQRLRLRPSVEKQLNTPGEAETDSVASGDDVISERVTSSRDDVTSERVRFDDHVSFIDEEWPTTSGGTPTMSRKEGYDWPRDSAISRQDVSPSSPDSWKSADSNPELEAASVQIYVESSVSLSPTEV